jgi:hypothetical protein
MTGPLLSLPEDVVKDGLSASSANSLRFISWLSATTVSPERTLEVVSILPRLVRLRINPS